MAEPSRIRPARFHIAPVVVAMLGYPVLRGMAGISPEIGVTMALGAVAYLLAIYLFYGIAMLAFHDQKLWLVAGGLGGVAAGIIAGNGEELWFVLASWAVVLVTGIVVGRMLAAGRRTLEVFFAGLIVLVALGLIAWYPTWQEIFALSEGTRDQIIQEFFAGQGATAEQIEGYSDAAKLMMALVVRLTPGSTIVSAIVQFGLAFLWFAWRVHRAHPTIGFVRHFIFWKVPFAVMPLLAVAILARLVGNDLIRLVADNALLVLSIFYALCGLSLMEYAMHRFGLPFFVRVLFYFLLFLTQVAGLLVMVMLGFIDSFLDWRKVSAKVSLEN